MSLRIRRGTENERSGIVFNMGEIVWTTNSQQLWVGDGVTQGGINILANSAGTGLFYNPTTKKLDFAGASYTTDDIAEGTQPGRQYFTAERAQDAAAYMFVHGTHSNITFTYDDTGADGQGKINASVTLDGIGITAVSQDTNPALGGNLTLNNHNITGTGGINITGSVTATSVTGNLVSSQITSLNPINIGVAATPTYLNVHSNVESLSVFNGITDNVTPPQLFVQVSRGSLTSPQTVVVGDQLGGILTKAFTGATFKSVSNIFTSIASDAVLSDLNPKSDVYVAAASGGTDFALFEFRGTGAFVVGGDGSAAHPSIAFSSDGGVDTGLFHPGDGILCVSTNAQESARFTSGGIKSSGFIQVAQVNGTLPTPAAGMIVLDGTTFKGYTGSGWVNLN
jgi:hypothetical protein